VAAIVAWPGEIGLDIVTAETGDLRCLCGH
jgi:hypothetical protein